MGEIDEVACINLGGHCCYVVSFTVDKWRQLTDDVYGRYRPSVSLLFEWVDGGEGTRDGSEMR